MQNALEAGTVRVLTPEGAIAGTGFLVSNTLVLTCAHVVQSASTNPGETLIIKYHLSDQAAEAKVIEEAWSSEDDIAVLEMLSSPPEGVSPMRLQSSLGMHGRRFQTLGYPQDGPTQVRWAQGEILGPVPVEGYAHTLLQIDGKQIDQGLSGAPLIEPVTGRVVGMITGYWDVVREANSPPLRMAYAIPIETVGEIFPTIKEYVKVSELKTDYLEERDLTDNEIHDGLAKLAELLPERAPVLLNEFSSRARSLRTTLGTDLQALSESIRRERASTMNAIDSMCVEVLDVSFKALCIGQSPPAYDSRSPFRGLESFRPEDHEFFFGREELTERLIRKLRDHPFLAILGASGSGKSSLVMAGLIPAFGRDHVVFRPSTEPLSALEAALASVEEGTLLVVDQFEELFTSTKDVGQRQQFLSRLLENTGKLIVVITMRIDFLGEIAPYRHFKDQIEAHQVIVPPMDSPELLKAIQGQAQRVGLRFESDLSEQMVDDVAGEPGAMPLLQHAAWILWQRRHGRWLRSEEYRAFGGVRRAIASTAEEVYTQCTELERQQMRDILLRLTRLEETSTGGHRDTRRRVPIRDLIPAASDLSGTILLLQKLADARLVVKSETEVEVAHETLIQHWDRLRDWLDKERKTLLIYQHLRQSAREWVQANRLPDLLYPPSRLKEVDSLQKHSHSLNADEVAFVTASQSNRKKQMLQKYLFWGIALILTGLFLAAFPLRIAYYAFLREQVKQASPMVELDGGMIIFGTDDPNRFSDEPALETRFVETFSIETTEVTNAKYRACVRAGICEEPKDTTYYDQPLYDNHPVVQITYDQAVTYCTWMERRLPDTYEWERAARGLAEDSRLWPWGDPPPSKDQANIILYLEADGWYVPEGTLPVGDLVQGKTPEGVFDLVGNVWEWTSTQPSATSYIQRGGSFDATMERVTKIRAPSKDHLSLDQAVGFRCAQ